MKKYITIVAAVGLGLIFLSPGGSTDEPDGVDISSGDHQIKIVAYAVPKVGFDAIIPAFRATPEGNGIGFAQSYGASGDQSRKVLRHVPADFVNFSIEPDITRLVKNGLVNPQWKEGIPDDESKKAVPFGSVVTFVTREGNPKKIHSWDDLLTGDIEVISPNPASSGSAKWNLLAPYAAWFFQNIAEQQANGAQPNYESAHNAAMKKLTVLVHTTFKVRPKSGREATSTFEQGQGDVLLSYENEAIFLKRAGAAIDYHNPPTTFRIENPVTVVNTSKNLPQAEAFRDYLFTTEAETIWAEAGFRPGSDLFGGTSVIETLDVEKQQAFAPYDTAYSIDDLAQAFTQLAKQSPELAEKHELAGKTGWGIVDSLLFGSDGAITAVYKEGQKS